MAADILVVDDEADIRELVGGILQDEGYETRLAQDSETALAAISQRRPSLVILDIWLQGSKLDGLEMLDVILRTHPNMPVVMISGHGNIETAVAAIKRGAYDYIEKPFKADRLILVVARALETQRLRRENAQLRGHAGGTPEIQGKSATIRQLRQLVKKAAPTNSRILISGPPGSGKELVARTIHNDSHRSDGPFVIVSATAVSPQKFEEELFGIEGIDATDSGRVGALEEAHNGTLLIEEVTDLSLQTQGQLLRVLVDQSFCRINGNHRVEVNVRIISSTRRDLESLTAAGLFREDLYHRLKVVPLDVPPLSSRREDIPLLIGHFCELYAQQSGQALRRLSDDAITLLQTYDWPGNVRQLRNVVERILILADDDGNGDITVDMLPSDTDQGMQTRRAVDVQELLTSPLREAREKFEYAYLSAQLDRFSGNVSKTAEFVGMERSALHRKIKTLGLSI